MEYKFFDGTYADIIIFNFEDNTFFLKKNGESGIFFLLNKILILKWYNNKFACLEELDNYRFFTNKMKNLRLTNTNPTKSFKDLSDVRKRITKLSAEKKYDIFVINLPERKNRYTEIIQTLEKLNLFNIHILRAIKNENGLLGCALSHLSLIKYAQDNNLDYIIIAEDDIIAHNTDQLKNILSWLTTNLDKWSYFNGSPTFWIKRNNLEDIKITKSENQDLIYLNWGQTTNFIIINRKIYRDLFKYLEEQIDVHYDVFNSIKFPQIAYKHGYIFYQKDDYSNVQNIIPDNSNYFQEHESILKNLQIN